MEYTAPDEVAVCNLASIALNRFVTDRKFDFKSLFEVTKVITRNLNKIIDINYYPVPEVMPRPRATPTPNLALFPLLVEEVQPATQAHRDRSAGTG